MDCKQGYIHIQEILCQGLLPETNCYGLIDVVHLISIYGGKGVHYLARTVKILRVQNHIRERYKHHAISTDVFSGKGTDSGRNLGVQLDIKHKVEQFSCSASVLKSPLFSSALFVLAVDPRLTVQLATKGLWGMNSVMEFT